MPDGSLYQDVIWRERTPLVSPWGWRLPGMWIYYQIAVEIATDQAEGVGAASRCGSWPPAPSSIHHVTEVAGNGKLSIFLPSRVHSTVRIRPPTALPAKPSCPRRSRSSCRGLWSRNFQGPSSSEELQLRSISNLESVFLSLEVWWLTTGARPFGRHVADLTFEVADADFAGVVLDQTVDAGIGEGDLIFGEAGASPSAFSPGSAWRSPSSRARYSRRGG